MNPQWDVPNPRRRTPGAKPRLGQRCLAQSVKWGHELYFFDESPCAATAKEAQPRGREAD